MRFPLSEELLRKLREQRAARQADEVESREDAFLLHPGMGPALYLTSDGRVLKDARDWDEMAAIQEASDDDAVAALVIGAENWSLPELLQLLPKPDATSQVCAACAGGHWFNFKDYYGKPAKM